MFYPRDRSGDWLDPCVNFIVRRIAESEGLDRLWPAFLLEASAQLNHRAQHPNLAHLFGHVSEAASGVLDVIKVRSPQKRKLADVVRRGMGVAVSRFEPDGFFYPNRMAQEFMMAVSAKPRFFSARIAGALADHVKNEATRRRYFSIDLGDVRFALYAQKEGQPIVYETRPI
jgi:hypothetical protein